MHLDLIHSDLCEPMSVKAGRRHTYLITFIDDYTHYGHVYMIMYKFEIFQYLKKYLSIVETKLERKV